MLSSGGAWLGVGPLVVPCALLLMASGLSNAASLPLSGAHGRLRCSDCHTAKTPSAHDVRCVTVQCHPDVRSSFRRTTHDVKYLEGHRPQCQDCHCGHPVVAEGAGLGGACTALADRVCGACHEVERRELPGNILLHRLPVGLDRRAIPPANARRRSCSGVVLRCFACHGVHDVFPVGDLRSPVDRRHVADTCGTCHGRETREFEASIHGRGVATGIHSAPTCISCHGAHGVRAVSAVHSPTGTAQVVFHCEDCHGDPTIVNSADLPLEVIENYEESLHGIARSHGISGVATCVSCHGAHKVLRSGDPRSPVNPARIRTTCAQCHARVTTSMIRKIRHPSGSFDPLTWFRNLRLYFPIARVAMNPLVVTGSGFIVGFLSGVFGVGGGFLMTPLLIFIGIPAAVAAATDSAQITAGASSGMISHARFGHVDFKMGLAMVLGGWPGGFMGVEVVQRLRTMGHFDFLLKLAYVLLLGFTGTFMFVEGMRTLRGRSQRSEPGPGRLTRAFGRLPFQVEFPRSGLSTSILEPVAVGFVVGILAAFLGVGGGFMLIPAMVYVIGIPTRIAVGTGLFQEVLVCAFVTMQQSARNHTVDLILAAALFVGSIVGAQVGVSANRHLRGEQIRVLLAVIVLGVMLALLYRLTAAPELLIQFARSGGG